jgi:hypothetical protein
VDEAVAEQIVTCRRCRYRFRVETAAGGEWRVEAQCPSCEAWACFTPADTQDPPRPDPAELDAEAQRLGEVLWRPVNDYRGHPAVAWLDRVGNGVFEDDHSQGCWPVPHWVYRFTRGGSAAYIWQERGSWFVRGWHPLRVCSCPPDPAAVFSFEAALDQLSG